MKTQIYPVPETAMKFPTTKTLIVAGACALAVYFIYRKIKTTKENEKV